MLICVNLRKSVSKGNFFFALFGPLREKEIHENPRQSASKIFLCALSVSVFISFNTAYSENSTTSYFNFLSLPTAPLIQQQQPPPIEKTEILAIIDFPGGRLIGAVGIVNLSTWAGARPAPTQLNPVNPVENTLQSAIRITGPVAFILKRTNLTNSINQSGILKFTVKITSKENCNVFLQRYPEISQKRNISLFESDKIEIRVVAQQNIVYLQMPFGERIEITNIEFLENTQLTENCNCKQVKEIDLSFLYELQKK